MNLLTVKKLTKIYGDGDARVEALKNVSFNITKGEFVAVVGESGSGKTTLFNTLGALDTPTKGQVFIDGKDIFSMKEEQLTIFRRRSIGFIFQSYNLIPELNVEQNIIFPLLLDYQKPDEAYVEELLEVLGLRDRRSHLPRQLSGGQQQRVAIGRALVTRPMLILADEPTGNLDPKTGDQVLQHLKTLAARFHQTIILVTHDMEIAAMADRSIRLHSGEIVEIRENPH